MRYSVKVVLVGEVEADNVDEAYIINWTISATDGLRGPCTVVGTPVYS